MLSAIISVPLLATLTLAPDSTSCRIIATSNGQFAAIEAWTDQSIGSAGRFEFSAVVTDGSNRAVYVTNGSFDADASVTAPLARLTVQFSDGAEIAATLRVIVESEDETCELQVKK